MLIQRQHGQEQAGVGNGRIRLEDGEDSQEDRNDHKGLSAQADGQPSDVGYKVQPEDAEEEGTERIEHLDEEIPPESNVRG